jgi:hypothetical protein
MQLQIDATSGMEGMIALLRAFARAPQEFQMGVMVATPADGLSGYHLLFTVGDTTAAMTIDQTQWLANLLVNDPHDTDLRKLGRLMFEILAEAPGAHGAH